MKKVVLDTNLYIGWLNAGRHADLISGRGLVRYLSAVVCMELRVGAYTRGARRALDQLIDAYEAAGRIVVPGARLFDDAAQVLQGLKEHGHDIRRASLVHDVLIALSARAVGATVLTANAKDFTTIRRLRSFALEVLPP